MNENPLLDIESRLIEADLRALGVTEADANEYEIVYQASPAGGLTVYRGIRHNARFVWDRHPDWPYQQEIR